MVSLWLWLSCRVGRQKTKDTHAFEEVLNTLSRTLLFVDLFYEVDSTPVLVKVLQMWQKEISKHNVGVTSPLEVRRHPLLVRLSLSPVLCRVVGVS